MRVLITGNRGFVGRHFERYYKAAGHDVRTCDIAANVDCRRYFDESHPKAGTYDLVVHCAAVVGGRVGIDGEPLHLMAEDLSIDAALFRWALHARPKRIVYFSSSAVYPPQLQGRAVIAILHEEVTQAYPGRHDATYGLVKAVGERMAREANALGIKTHVFRPFSGYGTEQSLDYPFPRFVERAANHDDPFEIWGSGDSARDWVHIDDIVGAVLAAIDNDVLGPVNICTGIATTFDQLAEMCMRRAGYRGDLVHRLDAPQGVHWRVGDPTKLHEFYVPRISLEEGIARALEARLAA
jgi:nucleoside-diphosphate-sugar epimerase